MCYLCVSGSLPCLWSSTKVTHQVWFVLEVKSSLKLFLQVLYATLVWTVLGNGLTGASWEAESVTGLTGQHHLSDRWTLTVQVFGEEKFKLDRWTLTVQVFGEESLSWSSRLFNPPPGNIKVLSRPLLRSYPSPLAALTTARASRASHDAAQHDQWSSSVHELPTSRWQTSIPAWFAELAGTQ
jgi:hypothetical protein